MSAKKVFSTRKAVSKEPVAFAVNDKDFHCVRAIPGMVLLDFISTVDLDNPASAGGAVTNFFKTAIQPEEWEDFLAYTRDPINEVGIDDLSQIAGWLAEQYMGEIPTTPAENSSAG